MCLIYFWVINYALLLLFTFVKYTEEKIPNVILFCILFFFLLLMLNSAHVLFLIHHF